MDFLLCVCAPVELDNGTSLVEDGRRWLAPRERAVIRDVVGAGAVEAGRAVQGLEARSGADGAEWRGLL